MPAPDGGCLVRHVQEGGGASAATSYNPEASYILSQKPTCLKLMVAAPNTDLACVLPQAELATPRAHSI